MTAAVTELTRTFVANGGDSALTSSNGVVAILLVILLLALKELIRAVGTPRAKAGIEVLNIAIVPLLLVFAFIVIIRVGTIIYPNGIG